MTISTTQRKVSYNGNGVTLVFAFPYRFLQNTDIDVVLVEADGTEVPQVQTTDYTLTGAGDDEGGEITMIVAPATGERLIIYREVELTQETDYISGDPFPAESHERALDKLTMADQQLQEQIDRTLILGIATPEGVDNELPSPQASQVIGWDASGTALRNYDLVDFGVDIAFAEWRTKTFSGDDVETEFVLDVDAGVASNIDLSVGGVTQAPGIDFTYDPETLTITFTAAPASGTNNVVARHGRAVPQGTVTIEDNSVTLSKLQTVAAGTVLGRNDGSGGDVGELTVTDGLVATSDELRLDDIPADSVLGSEDGGPPIPLTVGSGLAINSGVLEATGGGGGGAGGFKNVLINPTFLVNQRGYVSATNTTGANQYTLDRWRVVTSGQNISWSDSGGVRTVTAPAGGMEQVIEGNNLVTANYTIDWDGTATCTVGGVAKSKGDVTAVTGGSNLTIQFVGGTVSNPQFEIGAAATDFEKRPIGLELMLCQRYYYRLTPNATVVSLGIGLCTGSTVAAISVEFPAQMRVPPSALEQSGTASDYAVFADSQRTCSAVPAIASTTTAKVGRVATQVASGQTPGHAANLISLTTNGYLGFSAEL